MAKPSLPNHMKERRAEVEVGAEQVGPFLTISRQFGCYGFSLGLLLMEILNEDQQAKLKELRAEMEAYRKERMEQRSQRRRPQRQQSIQN